MDLPPPPTSPAATDVAPPPPEAPGGPRRLVRLPDHGRIAGVAEGLGAYLGIDPTLVRIAFIVLTIATGIGVPAYVIAWVMLPEERSGSRRAQRPHPTGRSALVMLIGAAVAITVLAGIDLFSGQVLVAAMLIGLGVLLFTDEHRSDPRGPRPGARTGPPTSPLTGPGPDGATSSRGRACGPPWVRGWERGPVRPDRGWGPTPPPPPPEDRSVRSAYQPYAGAWRPHDSGPRPPSRPPTVLGRLAFGASLLAAGMVALADRVGLIGLTATRGLGMLVGGIGLVLLVGTLFGRARWLIVLGLIGSLLLLTGASVDTLQLRGDVGQQVSSASTPADVAPRYDLLVGEQRIDLSALQLDGTDVSTEVRMTAGSMTIVLPPGPRAIITGRLRAGDSDVLGVVGSGSGITLDVTDDGDDPSEGTIRIAVSAGLGEVVVTRAARQ